MPHYYDFDSIKEKMFVLKHIQFGSKEYCKVEKVEIGCNEGDNDHYYKGFIKSILCEYLISVAVKIRMVQDYIKQNQDEMGIDCNDQEIRAINGLNIGLLDGGNLSLRESCNKIIHGMGMQILWNDPVKPEYDDTWILEWTAKIQFNGDYKAKKWICEINIIDWCRGIEKYLDIIEDEIDWHRVYKYDD
jgi:hypothetical protein